MTSITTRKRIWGWYFFDWAAQPYNTLLLTFIFGPYFAGVLTESFMSGGMAEKAADARAQTVWSVALTLIGVGIALLAPIFGAVADTTGRRMPWIWFFSLLYVIGSAALWYTYPDASNVWLMLAFFGIGFIGMEFAIVFTNSLLPDLSKQHDTGQMSGSGFAFGYVGGVVSLVVMLLFFAENETGKTLIGIDPLFGLDASAREGTRFVGPFTAIWFVIFMAFFFAWVREPKRDHPVNKGVSQALQELLATLKSLRHRKSLSAYLASSLFYRDALNGLYSFGGVYATLVLDWSIIQLGVFGISGAVAAAVFSWIGGLADRRWGPKPVIIVTAAILTIVCVVVASMNRQYFFGIALTEGSSIPDIVFYTCGVVIGACGGALQASSRTMMVRQSDPARSTEAFGLYALSGKATAFLAPMLIAIVTATTGSQQLGLLPLAGLFLAGLYLLRFVSPDPRSRIK